MAPAATTRPTREAAEAEAPSAAGAAAELWDCDTERQLAEVAEVARGRPQHRHRQADSVAAEASNQRKSRHWHR